MDVMGENTTLQGKDGARRLRTGSGEWTNTTNMTELSLGAAEQARETLGAQFFDCTLL
jgi:hypothetical protein